ncbi:fasciclin domain-containing protein [Roseisolibacter sp. H3M3-2]|uniref:fasciclin domain-containing protein n=1 Tax=Roseisolibacter sp. H3M3-2 TaxID=3031323 RepID=UPI0023DAD981|nr:fasciclin domain-containing protein [Roseisolibacter sp. H3M3-2]MDF1504204.1 fasciclin domain-containing protein [Roseisolibacter sp. H3M3-2]
MLRTLTQAAAVAAAVALTAPRAAQAQDIVETAVAAGQFTTLAKALTEAGLVETLKGTGPFTVFAPTDAAFAKLPPGTVEALLQDKAKLRSVLLYHVVPGKVTAADVAKVTSAKTVGGPSVKVMVHGGAPMIDNANVVKADVMASNGVIHVIDTVLMPPAGGGAGAAVRKDGR